MDNLDQMIQTAHSYMAQLQGLLDAAGLRYMPYQAMMGMASGAALSFGEAGIVLVSLSAGQPTTTRLTAGVAKNLPHERELDLLRLANERTGNNSQVPVYLHQADVGWDLLIQLTTSTGVFLDVPAVLEPWIRGIAGLIAEVCDDITQLGIPVTPYNWSPEDLDRLLIRSVM